MHVLLNLEPLLVLGASGEVCNAALDALSDDILAAHAWVGSLHFVGNVPDRLRGALDGRAVHVSNRLFGSLGRVGWDVGAEFGVACQADVFFGIVLDDLAIYFLQVVADTVGQVGAAARAAGQAVHVVCKNGAGMVVVSFDFKRKK